MSACKACIGAGKVLLLKSAFLGDGFRRELCGFCGGSGEASGYPCHSRQAEFLKMEAAMLAHKRQNPQADYIELGRIAQSCQ